MSTTDAPASSRRGANLVAAGILLSRLTGLVRESVLGAILGAGAGVEAFRAAFRIPNLMQNLLGEGVLSASFIPTYRKLLDDGRDEDAGRLAGAVAGLLLALTGALILVGVVAAGPITRVIAAGFPVGSDKYALTVLLVRILTPGIGVLVLSAWCLGVLNSHRNFFLPYVAPVLWNVTIIVFLTYAGLRGLADMPATVALSWGVVVGSVAQLAIQVPTVRRLEPNLRLSLDLGTPGLRRVLTAFGPVVGARGVVQLSAFVDLFLASFLATGGLASLGYAQVLYVLPISLFGMSVAAAELPELSSMDASDRDATLARVRAALERVAFFVVPAALVLLLRSGPVVGALFPGFSPDVTEQVALVLMAYSLALVPTTASRVVQSLRYGLGDTVAPARASIARVAVSTVVAVLLMFQLDRFALADGAISQVAALPAFGPVSEALRGGSDSVLRLGALGFGLGATAGAWVEYVVLRRATLRDVGQVSVGGGRLGRILGSAVVSVGGAALLVRIPGYLGLAVFGVVAGVAYLLLTRRAGIDEAAAVWRQGERLVARLRGVDPGDDDVGDDDAGDDAPRSGDDAGARPWSWGEVRELQRRQRSRRGRRDG